MVTAAKPCKKKSVRLRSVVSIACLFEAMPICRSGFSPPRSESTIAQGQTRTPTANGPQKYRGESEPDGKLYQERKILTPITMRRLRGCRSFLFGRKFGDVSGGVADMELHGGKLRGGQFLCSQIPPGDFDLGKNIVARLRKEVRSSLRSHALRKHTAYTFFILDAGTLRVDAHSFRSAELQWRYQHGLHLFGGYNDSPRDGITHIKVAERIAPFLLNREARCGKEIIKV